MLGFCICGVNCKQQSHESHQKSTANSSFHLLYTDEVCVDHLSARFHICRLRCARQQQQRAIDEPSLSFEQKAEPQKREKHRQSQLTENKCGLKSILNAINLHTSLCWTNQSERSQVISCTDCQVAEKGYHYLIISPQQDSKIANSSNCLDCASHHSCHTDCSAFGFTWQRRQYYGFFSGSKAVLPLVHLQQRHLHAVRHTVKGFFLKRAQIYLQQRQPLDCEH